MTEYRCPRCRFGFSPRAHYLVLDFCPRCLARHNVAISLERIRDTIAPPETDVTSAITPAQEISVVRPVRTDRQRLARVIDARRRLGP